MIDIIPDIIVKEKKDYECIFTIINHKPLENIKCEYVCENRLWSQNYNLIYCEKYNTNYKYKEGKIRLVYKHNKFHWTSDNDILCEVTRKLNDNALLNARLIDCMESGGKINIIIASGICDIRITSLHGSVTKLVIPPAVNMIQTDVKEIINNIQLIQLLHSIIM